MTFLATVTIRWKVTAAFAASLLVVLTGVGAFVYVRLDAELARTLDRGLQARADEVRAAVQRSSVGVARPESPTFEPDENVAQVLRPDGTLRAGSTEAPTGTGTRTWTRRCGCWPSPCGRGARI